MQNQFEGKVRVLRPSEKVFSVIMQRLTKWVFSRYDCTVDHLFFTDGQKEHDTLRSLFKKNAFVRVDGALNFPIHFGGEIVGVVRAIENKSELSIKKQKELNQLFSLMIEPTLKDIEQLEYVESLEEHMSLVHQDSSENLIRFRKKRSDEEIFESARTHQPDKTRLLLPCLIESADLDDSLRLSQEIHHQSGRYAFVSISDLDKESLQKPDDFSSVGPATLFVSSIESISKDQLNFLYRYMTEVTKGVDAPQVIATTKSIKALKEHTDDKMISLVQSLSVALIKMDRPFADYKKSGLMNLLFSALQPTDSSH